jgi:type I restriction enzyme S subunit
VISEPTTYITEAGFRASSARWIPSGSLVIALAGQGKTKGMVARIAATMTCNQSMAAIVPSKSVDHRFLHWWLHANYLPIRSLSGGDLRDGLNLELVGAIPVPLPPLDRQNAVADYLDAETARIDGLIAKKRRMIELLREQRAAHQEQAFGFNPGWKLKHLLRARMAYGVLVPRFAEPGYAMLRTNCLSQRGAINIKMAANIDEAQHYEYRRTILSMDDIVLSVVGSMGRSAVVGLPDVGANLNRPLARLQPVPELPSWLLWHWTQTTQFADQARLVTQGDTAQPTLNLGDLAQFYVGLPRDKSIWPQLLSELEARCRRLDHTEDALDRQIDLLQEHRQALISAAVTGELELSGAAA